LFAYLDRAQAAVENPRHLNTFLIGVLAAGLPIRQDCWMKAIETVFKRKIVQENKRVFLKGREMGKS